MTCLLIHFAAMAFFSLKIIRYSGVFAIPIGHSHTFGPCVHAFLKERGDLQLCANCIDAASVKIVNPTTLSLGYANPIRIRMDASSYPVTPNDMFVVRIKSDCDDPLHHSMLLKLGKADK